jgi:hypothetical protein
MKRSDILYRVLIAVIVLVVIAAFAIPQDVLDNNELLFLWVVLPVIGWLWIQAFVDGMKGN